MTAHFLMGQPVAAMAAAFAGFFLVVGLMARALQRQERMAARIAGMRRDLTAHAGGEAGERPLLRLLRTLGVALVRARLVSARTLADLEHSLLASGFRGDRALHLFLGAKLLLILGLPLLVLALLGLLQPGIGANHVATMMGAAALVGLLAPDLVVRRLRRRYLRALERGLPDALDLLVICAEAGLSLESGMERVASEIRGAWPQAANELALTCGELRIVADRRTALLAMGERTGLETLRRLAVTLIQAMQFGTPLTRALRTLAAEMRQEQVVVFEGRAARLPVLLTLPLIGFILPTVFLVVGGPAVLQIVRLM